MKKFVSDIIDPVTVAETDPKLHEFSQKSFAEPPEIEDRSH